MSAYERIKSELRSAPKTWLITGVAGFIGSNLLEELLKLGQRVKGLDNLSTGHSKNLNEVKVLVSKEQWERFDFIQGDIIDEPACARACQGVE